MPVRFIAEVSSNHHSDLGRSLAFIDKAAEIGCDAVKFQLFRVDQLFAPEVLARSETHRARKAWELPIEFLPELAARCRERGVAFACTPFYLDAVAELQPYVEFYKIASYELTWPALLEACARTGKPLLLSTGMADLAEVTRAVATFRAAGGRDITLLHCVSGYPAPPEAANLAAIETMRGACGVPIGWSDHTVDAGVIHRAVDHWGATIVEFHLDLDGTGEEFKTGHCWLPEQIAPVISAVRRGAVADGDGVKTPSKIEAEERDWRADPRDGLRPFGHVRGRFRG